MKRRITYFAVTAVALCVFIVFVVMTVMNDLVSDFTQKNHSFAGDCVVGTKTLVGFAYYEDFLKLLAQADCVEAFSPVIKGPAIKRFQGTQRDDPVEIMGINPVEHSCATGFGNTLYYHSDDASKTFTVDDDPNLKGCVLGDFKLITDTGEKNRPVWKIPQAAFSISCFPLTAKGVLSQADSDIVNTKTFYFSDQSISGLPRIDDSVVYLPFEQAQLLCGMADSDKRVSEIHIKFKKNVALQNGCEIIQSLWQSFRQQNTGKPLAYLLDTVNVQSWKTFRRESIGSMENERSILIVMFVLVGITTVFIILVVFYMIISHKSKDIGILRSVGASSFDIIELFFSFAILIGTIGSVVGLYAGWLFLANINKIEDWLYVHWGFQLWNRSMYAIGDIPNKPETAVLLTIAFSAIIACLCGALIPSIKAARENISETLQVNKL